MLYGTKYTRMTSAARQSVLKFPLPRPACAPRHLVAAERRGGGRGGEIEGRAGSGDGAAEGHEGEGRFASTQMEDWADEQMLPSVRVVLWCGFAGLARGAFPSAPTPLVLSLGALGACHRGGGTAGGSVDSASRRGACAGRGGGWESVRMKAGCLGDAELWRGRIHLHHCLDQALHLAVLVSGRSCVFVRSFLADYDPVAHLG